MAEKTTPHQPETSVVRLKFFGLVTCRPEQFVDELEKLCEKFTNSPEEYSVQLGYRLRPLTIERIAQWHNPEYERTPRLKLPRQYGSPPP